MCNIFQDMYDLILDYGCHCASHCAKPLTNVVNKLGFTPLTLAAKLARRQVNSLLERFKERLLKSVLYLCRSFVIVSSLSDML